MSRTLCPRHSAVTSVLVSRISPTGSVPWTRSPGLSSADDFFNVGGVVWIQRYSVAPLLLTLLCQPNEIGESASDRLRWLDDGDGLVVPVHHDFNTLPYLFQNG